MKKIPKSERRKRFAVSLNDEEAVKSYFESLGYIAKKLDINSKSKQPDFLFSRGDFKLYLEVKSFFDQEIFVHKEEIRKFVQRYFSPKIRQKWSLSTSDAILKMTNDDIKKNLKMFQEIVEYKVNKLNHKEINTIDGLLNLKVYNEKSEYDGNIIIGLGSIIKAADRLRDVISTAVKQFADYRNIKAPKLLVICKNDFFLKSEDLEAAQFGDFVITFYRDGTIDDTIQYGKNAAFTENRNTRLSAICLFEYNTYIGKRFIVLHNPYAIHKLPLEVFAQSGNRQGFRQNDRIKWINH